MGDHELFALNDANFSINEGEFVVILGPSGAGKSTLLNLLGGLDKVSKGSITVGNKDISNLNDNELSDYRAEYVGFVFQFYNLIFTLTVLENVNLIKDIVKNKMPAKKILHKVGLSDHLDKFPSELSGGEQQRVSIARAVMKDPAMLLCDEPTGALDSETGKIVLKLLQDLSIYNKKTVIIVTHNQDIAKAADKIIKVKNGKITDIIKNEKPLKISEVDL